jgi:hypothetical protein
MKSILLLAALTLTLGASSAFANLSITSVNIESPDYVIVKNSSSAEVDLTGYSLVEDDSVWKFPGGTKLGAGQTIKVYFFSKKKKAGEGAVFAKANAGQPGIFVAIAFGISAGETIQLRDKSGATISSKSV